MYFNNVETKPGIGYPKQWEDQEKYKGGWELKNGEIQLKSGSKMKRLMNIFHNPDQPTIDDYFEPWNYDYETLTIVRSVSISQLLVQNQQLQANLSTKLNVSKLGR